MSNFLKTLICLCISCLAYTASSSGQSIDDKIADQKPLDTNIRAKVGNHPIDISHSVYTGSYGKTPGIYVLQWTNNQVRGSFFNQNNTQEIRLYGDNSQPGRVMMEAWSQNIKKGSGLITKGSDVTGKLVWSGNIHIPGSIQIPIRMTKFTPRGSETLNSTSTYLGKLGNASIRVRLNWYSNGRVRGRYTNLNNNKSYDLIGYNYANGKIYLDEWDESVGDIEGGLISARVSLRKVTVNGRVQWQGRMFNIDKRNFAMNFSRTGSTGSNPGNNKDNGTLEKKLK